MCVYIYIYIYILCDMYVICMYMYVWYKTPVEVDSGKPKIQEDETCKKHREQIIKKLKLMFSCIIMIISFHD